MKKRVIREFGGSKVTALFPESPENQETDPPWEQWPERLTSIGFLQDRIRHRSLSKALLEIGTS